MSPINSHDMERDVDLDTVFRAMSQTMRRRILTALLTGNPRWKDEFESLEFRPAETEREAVRIELHHVHLPKLDDYEFIDWDPEIGRVNRGANFEEIRPFLELMDDGPPDHWP